VAVWPLLSVPSAMPWPVRLAMVLPPVDEAPAGEPLAAIATGLVGRQDGPRPTESETMTPLTASGPVFVTEMMKPLAVCSLTTVMSVDGLWLSSGIVTVTVSSAVCATEMLGVVAASATQAEQLIRRIKSIARAVLRGRLAVVMSVHLARICEGGRLAGVEGSEGNPGAGQIGDREAATRHTTPGNRYRV
jgi:hypothetical protein